jgi:hypothetical protein
MRQSVFVLLRRFVLRPLPGVMICVSAIAVFAVPYRMAMAAPTITCSRGISFGRLLPGCDGSITVRATAGSATVNNGCHSLISGAIRPAICTVRTTIAMATQDVRVTFTGAQLQFNNSVGVGGVTLDNYTIQTVGGSQLNSHTFNAAVLNPAHTFNVGGRLRFSAGEPVGSYNSSLNIVVTSIP